MVLNQLNRDIEQLKLGLQSRKNKIEALKKQEALKIEVERLRKANVSLKQEPSLSSTLTILSLRSSQLSLIDPLPFSSSAPRTLSLLNRRPTFSLIAPSLSYTVVVVTVFQLGSRLQGIRYYCFCLDRYYDDNEVLMNGLALGFDSQSQSDFDSLWNAALYRSTPNSGGKGSRKKSGGSISGSVAVGVSHVVKELPDHLVWSLLR